MTNSTLSFNGQTQQDGEVWQHLKKAIASSSGFQRWQSEKIVKDKSLESTELETQVYNYLKETLNTLAY
ncbi:conserved hypothetical protein [Gloeothece citriformis PCC 7424]|uniref:Uncharacterized protein n=1 Tax=Gloeothece citriformis (strain PCC 7424) TaxID=65393 RepID=B7KCK7_GLOC7|nr:hypothetical protein [Gloeothece citriformis]ACK71558.1 conserved hypothetical protein [Gloeothece citriformis PCC 7424]